MDDLTADSFSARLPAWVPACEVYATTDSTNLRALEWADAGARHGSVVVADHQSAGRGRLNRRWVAPAGSSLMFTVVLRPQWPASEWALLNLAAAVAVCRCLDVLGLKAAVKWPNDVLLEGRKVCGILAEAREAAVALGVGLNVRQRSFPEGLRHPATSLELAAGRRFDRAGLLSRILDLLKPLVDGPAEAVVPAYRPWCETVGRRVRVELADGAIEDVVVDVGPSGALILAGGTALTAGDVVELR